MAQRYDAIVIGGGHNGLVTAAYLARAGKKVVVLERRHVLGGAAVTEELYPGFKFTVCSYVCSLLRPQIIRDLDLPSHGFEVIPQESSFTPLPDGRYLFYHGSEEDTFQAVAKFSRRDAEAMPRFGRLMARMAKFIAPTLTMTPPDVGSLNPSALRKLLALNTQVKTLTEDELYTFARVMARRAGRVRGIDSLTGDGSSGKVSPALQAAPSFSCLRGNGVHLRGAIALGPSVDYIEKAYDDAKYGDYSHRPYVDMCVPSTLDPTLAPPGKHIMSCFIQYAPYSLRKGTWEERREEFGETVLDTIEEYIPSIRNIILHRQFLSPWDLEQMIGLTGGNIFHGELTPDQLLFLRPTPGWAQYRMPLKGLYLCGSGAHPGGGVMGAPGLNAAREILRDWALLRV